jgi:hypothetical protein
MLLVMGVAAAYILAPDRSDDDMIAELVLFAAVMAAMWQARRRQLRSLQTQEIFLLRLAEGVMGWRSRAGIPEDARQAIETLVKLPITGKKTTRHFALLIIKQQLPPPRLDQNPFWLARQQLSSEQREAFDWLLMTFFLAMTYSDWLSGGFLRRVRFGGLSRETQAEIAIETVLSRNWAAAVQA